MTRAIGDHVFVRRDPVDREKDGISISEKAQVKSYLGEVAFVAPGKRVSIGDRVHLPHHGVHDVVVDGEEYALTKAEDLFCVENDGTFAPIGGYVLVRKCVNDHIRDESGGIALYMVENHIETTNWVEIMAVAPDCGTITEEYVGYFCVAPENDDRLQRVLYSKDYCLHESLIKFVTDGG